MTVPLTQGHIEQAIMALSDELEAETERYSDVADLAANAEADYKHAFAETLVRVAADPTVKRTADERRALADLRSADARRVWLIAEARRTASRETLLSLRARLDALRTLSANVRAQT